ncbi:MAG: flavin reductase family protein [Burkholderiales bacterium]|nr:flavin reductase family protein [Burkholderiales bacterium]
MQIDPDLQSDAHNYRLLTSLVIPRPIAWVTSLGENGVVNLAPFSFFNALGGKPMYLIVSIAQNDSGEQKDTAKNLLSKGEFVVNFVTEALFDAMNLSAADFPSGESELAAAGLGAAPCVRIGVPRVAEAEASLECRLHQTLKLGENTLFIGEVVMFHVADHLLGEGLKVKDFFPIGRLGSPAEYCRTSDRFNVPRISYKDWLSSR